VGVFHTLIPDNVPELVAGEFRKKSHRVGSIIRPVETDMHNQQLAEAGIRELRRAERCEMERSGAPRVLWDHCTKLVAEIQSHTALDVYGLDGDAPITKLTGDTPDISHLCEFAWYEVIWYHDPVDKEI